LWLNKQQLKKAARFERLSKVFKKVLSSRYSTGLCTFFVCESLRNSEDKHIFSIWMDVEDGLHPKTSKF